MVEVIMLFSGILQLVLGQLGDLIGLTICGGLSLVGFVGLMVKRYRKIPQFLEHEKANEKCNKL